ncbi:MAG: hypothetical protein OEQ13_13975 [Acidobacteriota bacterium]|nr:hypothetical protein [Acidobacteriota bacterium]
MTEGRVFLVNLTLTILAASFASASAPGRLAPDEIAELDQLVRSEQCGTLLNRVEELKERAADDPDLLVAEGNCRMILGRQVAERFDAVAFENAAIALGRESKKSDLKSGFFYKEVTYEEEAVASAMRLFRAALDAAPERQDLIVGNIALLTNVGLLDDAVALLGERGTDLDRASTEDLGQLVQDQLKKGRHDRGERLARELSRLLPESAAGPAALAGVLSAKGAALGAMEALSDAHQREPALETVTAQLIMLSMTSRRFENAISLLVPRVDRSLQNKFWFGIARERVAPGSTRQIWEQLVEKLREASATDPVTNRVVSHYARAVKPGNNPTPVMRLRIANQFIADGILLPGIVEADHAVAEDPRLVEAWMLLARAYRGERLFDLALEAVDRGLAATTEAAARQASQTAYGPGEFVLARAQLLMGLGRYEEALSSFEEAAERGQPAKDQQALAALRSGQREAAIKLMRELAAAGGARSTWAAGKLEQLGEAERPRAEPAPGAEGGS